MRCVVRPLAFALLTLYSPERGACMRIIMSDSGPEGVPSLAASSATSTGARFAPGRTRAASIPVEAASHQNRELLQKLLDPAQLVDSKHIGPATLPLSAFRDE